MDQKDLRNFVVNKYVWKEDFQRTMHNTIQLASFLDATCDLLDFYDATSNRIFVYDN